MKYEIASFYNKNKLLVIFFLFVILTITFIAFFIAKDKSFCMATMYDCSLFKYIQSKISLLSFVVNELIAFFFVEIVIYFSCSNNITIIISFGVSFWSFYKNIYDFMLLFFSFGGMNMLYSVIVILFVGILFLIFNILAIFFLGAYHKFCKSTRCNYFCCSSYCDNFSNYIKIVITNLIVLCYKIIMTILLKSFLIVC